MPTQMGYIDLSATNSVMLAAEAGWSSDLEDYATKADLTVSANNIKSEVSETYATKTEVRRTDTGSGTVVSSDDAANLPPLSLTIHGKSVQDGTPTPSAPVEIRSVEGRNLSPFFSHDITDVYSASTNPNGYWFWFSTEATWTQKDNGWVHVEYSNTGSSAVYPNCIVNQVPALKNGASYTFIVEIANATISGDVKFSPNGSAGSTVAHLNNVTAFSIANNSTYYKSTTAKSDFSGCNRFTRSYFNVSAGGSISLDLRISIYEGGYAGAYQPYQHIKASITGKNLLDLTRASGGTSSGITVTPNGDGTFGFVGTATASAVNVWLAGAWGASAPTLFTLPAGTYTVKDCVLFNGTAGVGLNATTGASSTKTLTAPTPITGIRAPVAVNGKTYDTVIKPQLEYGSEATEYTPYTDASAFIPLQGNALRSLPDGTEDTIEVDGDGNVTLTKRAEEVDLGTLTWTWQSAWGSWYTDYFTDMRAVTTGVSTQSYLLCTTTTGNAPQNLLASSSTVADGICFTYTGSSGSRIVCRNGSTTETPTGTLIYPLATPQTISLGKIDLPPLPSPSFSMHVDALVTPTLDAEWWTQGGEEVGSVYQRTSALEQDAEGLSVRMSGLETDAVRKSKDEWTAWLDVGTDSDNNPFLAMGQSGNDLNSRLSNESMSFYNGTEELMKLSGADGVKADTVRSKRVYIGSWILEELDSGDMAIKLVGGGA